MQLLPTDTWTMRLVRVCGELTDSRHGQHLYADHVDNWMRNARVSWRDLVDWILRRALKEAEAEVRSTPAGERLWVWNTWMGHKVPQWGELLDRLEYALVINRIESGAVKGELDWATGAKAAKALQDAMQCAADDGVHQDDLEELMQFWADVNNVTLVIDRTAPGAVGFTVRW